MIKMKKYILYIKEDKILVALDKNSTPSDHIKSYFQATYIRLQGHKNCTERTSYKYLADHFTQFITELERNEWNIKISHLKPELALFTLKSD